ncbi:hypothetical protein [Microbacterium sp. JZ31]|uniref:hypothetical protein n=1 Tax=Microbacterium sp. JZ31 TaxID=1906274 RepID=UPI00193223E1|nr:hypothetical protein [Microbacterium sp. JZ31]
MTDLPVLDALADEFLNNYSRGRILVAVDGPDAAAAARFADALADTLRGRDRAVFRAGAPVAEAYRADEDRTGLRETLAAFREGAVEDGSVPEDAALIVDGRFLLSPKLRGAWHFRIWLESDLPLSSEAYAAQVAYTRDEAPRGAADAIYDVTDPDAPRRVWSDSC